MRLLNEAQWEILISVEEHWGRKGVFPTVRRLSDQTKYPEAVITDSIADPLFKDALDRRGITFVESDKLTEKQMAVALLVANVYDHRSIAEKCKACGVTPATYYNWKKDPYFAQYLREVTENMFGDYMPEVHQALVKNAVAGDFKSIEMFYKVSGRFNDKDRVDFDLRRVMNGLQEAIQKVVKDPVQLNAIASEFEKVLAKEVIQGEISG